MINNPLIIAHRGASDEAYENSFSAFNLAVEQGADMIELDTHLTKDGFFVVHHDPKIKYKNQSYICLLYTSPSPRDLSTSRMPSSA